jgi:hypothetical protein
MNKKSTHENLALTNPSGYDRNHFAGSWPIDDEFANFLDLGAYSAQRAMYAAEAAKRQAGSSGPASSAA